MLISMLIDLRAEVISWTGGVNVHMKSQNVQEMWAELCQQANQKISLKFVFFWVERFISRKYA